MLNVPVRKYRRLNRNSNPGLQLQALENLLQYCPVKYNIQVEISDPGHSNFQEGAILSI